MSHGADPFAVLVRQELRRAGGGNRPESLRWQGRVPVLIWVGKIRRQVVKASRVTATDSEELR